MSKVETARRALRRCSSALALLIAALPLAGHAAAGDEARVIVKFRNSGGTTIPQPGATPAQQSAPGRAQVQGQAAEAGQERALAMARAASRIGDLGRRSGLALHQGRMLSARMHVVQASGLDSRTLAEQLSHDPDVEYAVVDARRRIQTVTIPPDDPLYPDNLNTTVAPNGPAAGQWYLRAPDTSTTSGINAEPAWALTTGSASGPIVAVLDTGVRYEHPDLLATGSGGKLLPGASMLSGQSGGYSDDATDTGDWVAADQCGAGTPAANSSWHGTQVAGLIGALSNNATGMASVGWDVRVLPVRVLAQCGGYDSDIIAAMNWVVGGTVSGVTTLSPSISSQVKVINLSLGSDGACTQAYIDAINNVRSHGVVVVAAAGNTDGQAVSAPANCPGVIAVGGLRHTGTKVGYSAVGSEISLSAPGGNCVNLSGACLYPILTTTNAGATVATTSTYSDSYNISTGTSFSTPLVSGTAALMLTARPALLPDDVRRLLRDNARAFPTAASSLPVCHAPDGTVQEECVCTTSTCGAGMLDAGQSVAAAASGVVPRITVSPASPQPGQTVTFDASASLPSTGGTAITGYAWTIKSSGGIVASFNGPANAAQVSVTPSGTGTFTVELQLTDDAGTPASATTTQSVAVTAPPVTAQSSGGGGGGGAASALSLLLLALAVAATARQRCA